MNNFSKLAISTACAPKAGNTLSNQQASRIWSPTQVGAGTVGSDRRPLAVVFESHKDPSGYFQGETPYVVLGEIQVYPAVSALLRPTEWRAAVKVDQLPGLLYRKLSPPNGFANSWLTSAETAVHSWVGNWGKVTSDRNAGIYRFEALNLQGRPQPTFPDIDELIDELLADYVIDSLDHPVLERLLNPAMPSTVAPSAPVTPSMEDDDEVY
jgi:hypothetical protein